MQPINTVIFDMDGLMFDTERVSIPSWVQAAKEQGFDLAEADVQKGCGMNFAMFERYIKSLLNKTFDFELALKRREEQMAEWVRTNGVIKKPGLDALIAYLEERKMPKAIASGTATDQVYCYLEKAELAGRFVQCIGGDQVKNGKPAPDIYLKTAEALKVLPENCLVLEDSENGVRAANAAGMRVLMVPDLVKPSEEVRQMAAAVLVDLSEAIGWIEKAMQ